MNCTGLHKYNGVLLFLCSLNRITKRYIDDLEDSQTVNLLSIPTVTFMVQLFNTSFLVEYNSFLIVLPGSRFALSWSVSILLPEWIYETRISSSQFIYKIPPCLRIKFNLLSLPSIVFALPTFSHLSPGTRSVNSPWPSINLGPGMVLGTKDLTPYDLASLNHVQPLRILGSLRFLCLFTFFFSCIEYSSSLLHHDKYLWFGI